MLTARAPRRQQPPPAQLPLVWCRCGPAGVGRMRGCLAVARREAPALHTWHTAIVGEPAWEGCMRRSDAAVFGRSPPGGRSARVYVFVGVSPAVAVAMRSTEQHSAGQLRCMRAGPRLCHCRCHLSPSCRPSLDHSCHSTSPSGRWAWAWAWRERGTGARGWMGEGAAPDIPMGLGGGAFA